MIVFFLIIILLLASEWLLAIWGWMMGGIRRPVTIVEILVPYREYPHEEGFLELGHGKQEIFIPTCQTPTRVWLCFDDFEGVQCCLGQVDKISAYCTRDGFVALAEINSESAFVKWVADFV